MRHAAAGLTFCSRIISIISCGNTALGLSSSSFASTGILSHTSPVSSISACPLARRLNSSTDNTTNAGLIERNRNE